MDSINIKNLKVYANHGVYDFEKEKGQNFYISCSLLLDIQKAAFNDELDKTVNYAAVACDIAEYTKANCYDLIETLAEGLAVLLLNKYKNVMEADIEISKPEAPVEMEFENISVKLKRKRHIAYIAYGSNEGNSLEIIDLAKKELNKSLYCNITAQSSLVKSTAYGVTNQPDFYNGILELETYLEADSLLSFLHEVEAKGKRVRKEHWGPRTLDLDIILYDDLVLDSKELTIPHIDMKNRDFVLEPLAEIAGFKRHPVYNKTINEMLADIKEKHVIGSIME